MSPPRAQNPKADQPPATGVAASPGGLGAAGWWGVSAVLVAGMAAVFYLAAEPLGSVLGRVPALGSPPATETVPGEPAAEISVPALDQPRPRATPRQPEWTLVDVEAAVRAVGVEIGTLIEEGVAEMPELRGLDADEPARAARARERFASWRRIWHNRVKALGAKLPPPPACAVHAAMEPACGSLREVLSLLDGVADAGDLETVRQGLDAGAERLDLFLNPPQPEPEEGEGEGESDDAGNESQAAGDSAQT